MPIVQTFPAPLTQVGAQQLAQTLPRETGLYVLGLHLPDGRSVPLRVGIATGAGGLRSRIVVSSTSHYASACASPTDNLALAYPNYANFFAQVRAVAGATTSWVVVSAARGETSLSAEYLKVLERQLIHELQPIWEISPFKSRAGFSRHAPEIAPLVEHWWTTHGASRPWEERVREAVASPPGPDVRLLQRVTLELTSEVARELETHARDLDATISEVIEYMLRAQYRETKRFRTQRPAREPDAAAVPDENMTVREAGWELFLACVNERGLVWDGAERRSVVRDGATGQRVIVDLNPNTLKGYAFPPPGYVRPPYARVYAADNAVNVGELTLHDFDALLAAMGYPPQV